MARLARLDKKELKQDPLLNFAGRAADWVNENMSMAIGIVAAVVVGGVLLGFWASGRTDKSSEGNVRMAAAVGAYNAGEYQVTLDMANSIVAAYPGTQAAIIASYLAGQSHLQLGGFAEAERAFQQYINQADKAPFYKDAATKGLAASLEGQQRHSEAAQMYVQVSEKLPEPLASEARLDAARSYRFAGNMAQAKSLLERVDADQNQFSNQARIELAVLKGLEGATAPSVTPAPPANETQTETPQLNP